MATEEPEQSEHIDPKSHPAISQRKKKQPKATPSQDTTNLGDLFDALKLGSVGGEVVEAEPKVVKAGSEADKEYSNEARVYHARYAALSADHDNGRLALCREGCLGLLTGPNLPLMTKMQTLQMLSTLLSPSGAEEALKDAAEVLNEMDAEKVQVALLKGDNEKMLADLETWRAQEGLIGQDLESALVDRAKAKTSRPLDASYYQFDRVVENLRGDELVLVLQGVGVYATEAELAERARPKMRRPQKGEHNEGPLSLADMLKD